MAIHTSTKPRNKKTKKCKEIKIKNEISVSFEIKTESSDEENYSNDNTIQNRKCLSMIIKIKEKTEHKKIK